ncbi:MAG: hydroxylamine reductase, partial [Peptococcaceae bacterium]|nr:hydroxylamine reductase [Peptococcaceae bacterium]
MDTKMFCMQCEQTAGGKACTNAGVCGKTANTARLQDQLTGALIVAAGTTGVAVPDKLLLEALFATLTNVNFDDPTLEKLILQVGHPFYDLNLVHDGNEDIRSLKTLLLLGIRGVAAYAYHALVMGYDVAEITAYIRKGLAAIGEDSYGLDELLPLIMECGKVNLIALEILDRANNKNFGTPAPITVTRTIAPGPFIVISGHDLFDLKLLLEQTKGKGVNVYTHGEMLPAHAYPELNKYSHLKGNFGTAWQNQQKEFDNVPGAFLFTTNCLMPPKTTYSDRVFTTAVVAYPGLVHIDENKDFSPVIAKAIELGGFSEPQGSGSFTTGFGQKTVLRIAGTLLGAVQFGTIKHFFLVGGCDGAKPGRNYYTEFVEKTPNNTVVLTLACGKYRFNHLDAGSINGLPRILDMGQCN